MTFAVTDVQKNKGGKYMHYGKLTQGTLKVGDTVTAALDVERRKAIMRAHSATHLLDKALRTVLGDHVHQAGSLVEPDRLRFDFTHFSALTAQELGTGERHLVNEAVLEGYDIVTQELPIEEAKKKRRHRPVRREVWRHRPCGGYGRAATPWSSAAAPTWTTPPRWACSTSPASSPWPPASAASRPPPARPLWP